MSVDSDVSCPQLSLPKGATMEIIDNSYHLMCNNKTQELFCKYGKWNIDPVERCGAKGNYLGARLLYYHFSNKYVIVFDLTRVPHQWKVILNMHQSKLFRVISETATYEHASAYQVDVLASSEIEIIFNIVLDVYILSITVFLKPSVLRTGNLKRRSCAALCN